MLNDAEINNLINCPKKIIDAIPRKGMANDNKSSLIVRKNLKLVSEDDQHRFDVFMRHNTKLTEQFSIGLRYKTNDRLVGSITLIRFNGEHGQRDWSKDQHYRAFHIHKISETLLENGIYEPKEILLTDRFCTFDSAVNVFLRETNIINCSEFFPISDRQMQLFEG